MLSAGAPPCGLRVPFVPMKTGGQVSNYHMLKSARSAPAPTREALYFGCTFADNMTLFFMTTRPLYRGMNHVFVRNRENTAPVRGAKVAPPKVAGGSRWGPVPGCRDPGSRSGRQPRGHGPHSETSTRGPCDEHRRGFQTAAGLGGSNVAIPGQKTSRAPFFKCGQRFRPLCQLRTTG